MKTKMLVVAAIITSSRLVAQDTAYKPLDEVVFTANKYPKKQSETGKVVSVISKETLEQMRGKSTGDILNTNAGIHVIGASVTAGSNQTINIRGASAGNVLLLIDGIPVNDPSVITNYFDLNLIPVDQIERIEILKGGHSTLYGSDAVAGVINIITVTKTNRFELNAGLTAGSYHTFKQDLSVSGAKKKMNYSVHYTHHSADGFSSAKDTMNTGNFDKDGFNQHALTSRISFPLSSSTTGYFTGTFQNYKNDIDASAYSDDRDFTAINKNLMAGSGVAYSFLKGKLNFNYHFNYTDRQYDDDSIHKPSMFVNYSHAQYIGRSHFTELYITRNWKNFELLTGIDHRLNHSTINYFSSGPFGDYAPPTMREQFSQTSPYSSLVFNKRNWNAEAGLRWNHHSEYGNNVTFTINPSFKTGNTKIFANAYSAFKTPTLYQLFDPFFGNPDLGPEKNLIGELGFEYRSHFLFTRVTGFSRKGKDAINFIIIDPVNFTSRYKNVSEQENYGVEFESAYKSKDLSIMVNYTYTDGKTVSQYDGTGFPMGKDTSYYNLYRIPKHAVNASMGINIVKNLNLRADLRVIGKRDEFVFGASPITLDAYHTLDFHAGYTWKKWNLFLDLRNITDQDYEEIPGYNSRKFNWVVGMSIGL